MGPAHAHALVDAACRAALGRRAWRTSTVPNDWQEMTNEELSPMNVAGHTSTAGRPPIVVPQEASLKSAADLLNAGKKTVILVGQGALGAGDEVEQIAEGWARRSSRRCWARRSSPTTSPYTTGGLGLLGTLPSEKAMEECDTLLIVGTSFPYMTYLPKPGQAKAVQIDRDATRHRPALPGRRRPGRRRPGDARRLLPLLQRREGPLVPGDGAGADEGVVGADAQARGSATTPR